MVRLLRQRQCRWWVCMAVMGWLCGCGIGTSVARGDGVVEELPPASRQQVDFERDIRPLLAEHCFDCHGDFLQESGLRLDRQAILLRGGNSGEPAVIPGNSAQSQMILLVAGVETDRVMPPSGDRLTDQEIGLLRAWIDQGAKWSGPGAANEQAGEALTTDFWSFQPLKAASPPATNDPWVSNPIDAFILAGLRSKALRPSDPADRRTLIRRVYFDMLGLSPSPEEIARFIADGRPDAYARLVDRVLANPHYGERWARHWLDVVRFAESDGFEMNHERPNAYHYRDYVIEAFNNDKPYDEFVFEQLAGDTVGIDAATGFLVGGAYDKVKSPNVALTLMQRQDELADMVNTTATAFLGLTVGCARCHNHKFDPILQRDYYAMQAVFAGVQHGERPLRRPEDSRREERLADVERRITILGWQLSELGIHPPVNARRNVEYFPPTQARSVRMTIAGTNTNIEPCVDELEIYSVAFADEPARNVALASNGAIATVSGTYPGSERHKLEHINDGRFGNSRSWISNTNGTGWVQIELPRTMTIDRIVWGRDREEEYTDRLPTDYVFEVAIEPGQWREVASSRSHLPAGDANEVIVGTAFPNLDSQAKQAVDEWFAELADLERDRQTLSSDPMVYAGRFEQPPPTHRLYRGDPMAPREVVPPDVLTVLGTLDVEADAPEAARRVAFAHWIASADNPLTARVIVNRIWQFHFGEGIVDTPSDFGANGTKPMHPELLDWLAKEFIENGWSMKHLHRLILLSSTYRQSGAPRPDALAIDASSRLLWRFPPRRHDAEVIRDSILSVSDVLDASMGRPGFSPFEPNDNYVRVYIPKQKFGPKEWRRMVYMTKIRMENDTVFGAFDVPDGGRICPKRGRSTTAIQSLNLFNSGFVMQQSRLFAERVQRDAGDDPGPQVIRAFELALGREPDSVEATAAGNLVKSHGLPALCRALLNANEFLFLP